MALKSGMELDVFIFEYIFDGLIEKTGATSQVPSFSRRAEAAKMLLIRMFAENSGLVLRVKYGHEWCDKAKASGQLVTERMLPVWVLSIENPEIEAYGRTYEEAVSKMAILFKRMALLG